MALTAGVATPAEWLGDSGVAHALIHGMIGPDAINSYGGIIDQFATLNPPLPGWWAGP